MSDDYRVKGEGRGIWVRGLYMLLFVLLYSVAELVMTAVVLLQFGFHLVNGMSQPRLLSLGAELASYLYQVFRFLSFNTEVMPYPFSDWPQGEAAQPIMDDKRDATRGEG